MTTQTKLIIGMPSGSLADPTRGGSLNVLLRDAGFETKGYDKGGPTAFTTVNYLFGWDGRPQEFGSQIDLGEVDLAIAGDDWVRERRLEMEIEYGQTYEVERVLSLRRGGVRIVGITADREVATIEGALRRLAEKHERIAVVTEMPYVALDWMRKSLAAAGLAERFDKWSVQKYRTPPRVETGVVIYESWGKTEAKLKNGGADLGVEITQSGSAIRNYGLKIIDEVMTSEAAVFMNPTLRDDPEKLELARMFLLNLEGAVNAEDKVMVIFDVSRDKVAEVEAYLEKHHLFADEPSKTEGEKYIQYSIQMLTDDAKMPISKARYDLAKLGARSINTMPLQSAIPSVDAVKL